MASLKYWLWLASRKNADPASLRTVLDHFATPERVYYAEAEELELLPVRPSVRAGLLDKELDTAERIWEACERLSLRVLTIQDSDYPDRLRQLTDPPAVLYIRGRSFAFDEEAAIGMVGAREPSPYGIRCAEKLGMELAAGGALVVSGIAEGLDSCAIRGALKAGGPVVSVLAGGVDVPFPPRNRYLYEDVAAAGALISEYPPGISHMGFHFPRRNRILSGLCLGVLAVECRPFGGTMSTMDHALEQDRDLFAVPGPIDAPMSEGTNRLIQQGAKLVTCGRDILEEYWSRFPQKLLSAAPLTPEAAQARLDDLEHGERPATSPTVRRRTKARSEEEKTPEPSAPETVPWEEQKRRFTDDELVILAALGDRTCPADELVERTQIPARRVLSALTTLQIQGAAEELPGKRFAALVRLEE